MIEGGKVIDFPETRLIGSRRRMSFVTDRTSELWREFRAIRPRVADEVGSESYSVKVFDGSYSFEKFDPTAEFDKWAAAAVMQTADVPDGLEPLTIPAGKYAEFLHVGPASEASKLFADILGRRIPRSEFELDLRPHFEILPEDYDPFSPQATERVLIPIRPRS